MNPKIFGADGTLRSGTGHQRERDDSPDVSQSSRVSSWFCYFKSIKRVESMRT